MCNKSHDWLFLPRWTKEGYMRSLNGKGMVGGHVENGVRVGGELVSASEWLNSLETEWGFAKE